MTSRIPITLITGYLGSGKTTLINHLLSGDHGRRIAVLVNDFGSVNIDAALIVDQDEEAISLANGCVCCSVSDDLGLALDAQASREEPPELVVLEASGVAEPSRIARLAGHWPGFELDGIITLVDAETVQARAKDKFVGRLVKNQIVAGDIVIINKTDLVSEENRALLQDWIAHQAPDTTLISAVSGQVSSAFLIGLSAQQSRELETGDTQEHAPFRTLHWVPSGPLDIHELGQCLDKFPASIHRVKGFFHDAETNNKMLLQRVGRRWTAEKAAGKAATGLVLITAGPTQDLDIAEKLLQTAQK